MTTAARITRLLEKTYSGPAWHGPAVAEILADVTATQAAARPAIGTHSIWELVLHMIAWKDEVRRRLSGPGRRLPPEENWPRVPEPSDAAWREAVERMNASHQALVNAVSSLTSEQFATRTKNVDGGLEELLDVIIHHDLYHAGQIAILKTQGLAESPTR